MRSTNAAVLNPAVAKAMAGEGVRLPIFDHETGKS